MPHDQPRPSAELGAPPRTRTPVLGAPLVALVLLASSMVVFPARPAAADQVSSLQQQAATIAQKLLQEQLQVDAQQQQVAVATARVQADQADVARLTGRIADDQRQVGIQAQQVRKQAILDYVTNGSQTSGPEAALFSGNTNQLQAATEYSHIAVGNITTSIDRLRTAQDQLEADQASLEARQSRDQAAQAAQSQDLGQAQAATGQLEAEQSQVKGQLTAAVAAQQKAQAAAAAAAVAKAQAAARASQSRRPSTATPPTAAEVATTGSGSSGPAGSSAGSAPASTGNPAAGAGMADPALPPFLQCVVQAESGGNYGIVSPGGTYMGAFQFSQSTWNTAASAAGLGYLVGVPPNQATKAEQDTVALTLYEMDGEQPWLGDRCS